jgi:hypothetical protein
VAGRAQRATTLAVWAQPNASRARIVGRRGEAVKVAVAAPPEKGKANRAVERLLAEALGLSASRVRIVAGAAARAKTVRIVGRDRAQIEETLKQQIGPPDADETKR